MVEQVVLAAAVRLVLVLRVTALVVLQQQVKAILVVVGKYGMALMAGRQVVAAAQVEKATPLQTMIQAAQLHALVLAAPA
jgi:hypothetical protein